MNAVLDRAATLTVRTADMARDAAVIVRGAREFAEQAPLRALLPEGDALTESIGLVVTLEQVEIVLAEHDGRVVAGLGVAYVPHLWNQSVTVAEELFWWAFAGAPMRAGRAVFDEALRRIDARGAVPMFRALSTSPPGVDRLYRRSGMDPVETTYMRRAR